MYTVTLEGEEEATVAVDLYIDIVDLSTEDLSTEEDDMPIDLEEDTIIDADAMEAIRWFM